MTKNQDKPSQWQQRITGQWYGIPAVFDAEGNHAGFNKVHRSSVFEDGRTTYLMDTDLDITGPLRPRFEAQGFAFGVIDSDRDRIYLGPDFIGAGHPYGALVDAHYYSPGWTSDLRTMVHILPDEQTQVYSSLLYDGPALAAVFNGVYKVAVDYDSQPETKARIDSFLTGERERGAAPHILPMKIAGEWTGEVEVYSPERERLGTSAVKIEYRPETLLRAAVDVSMEGVFTKRFAFVRQRNGNRHAYEGPDVYGNAISYGRALYTSQHVRGESFKIQGREFLIDDNFTLSVVWKVLVSDQPAYTMFGVLAWQPDTDILQASHE